MGIEFLEDLSSAVDRGTVIYVCQGPLSGKWEMHKTLEGIKQLAKRSASAKKLPIKVMRLVNSQSLLPETPILIPSKIGDDDNKGMGNINWSIVDTAEAAETLRDVRHGPSPYFGLEEVDVVSP